MKELSHRPSYTVLGLMSGTSLDGLDLALCRLEWRPEGWQYQLLATGTVPYEAAWRQRLAGAIGLGAADLDRLDSEYGRWLGRQAAGFLQGQPAPDLIASHGHTVFHEPHRGITRQIGRGQELARITGVPVVCNFRQRDVQLGGQGAPLVPVGDELLFGEYTGCLNLGGIANISFRWQGQRMAFDTGPANMLLNHLAAGAGLLYDEDGRLARSGRISQGLLNELEALPYYRQPFPKSLGYEWFAAEVIPLLEAYPELPVADKLATAVRHVAGHTAAAIRQYLPASGRVLTTGGGAFNRFLLAGIAELLPSGPRLVVPGPELVAYKEALVFALLGVLRVREETNCYRSVTGASRDSCGGDLILPD